MSLNFTVRKRSLLLFLLRLVEYKNMYTINSVYYFLITAENEQTKLILQIENTILTIVKSLYNNNKPIINLPKLSNL